MPVNEIEVDAPPSAVWAVLADPPTYEEWVVGNKEIRDHDPKWPTAGTEFHHKVGFGPVAVKDKTVSMEAVTPAPRGTPPVPRGRLVMNVRAFPIGHGVVSFDLTEAGGGTRVRMEELPAGGPIKAMWLALAPLVKVRNAETLRRLKRLSESRHRSPTARR
jgi:carbon monoxide dehydrogenase subunit G